MSRYSDYPQYDSPQYGHDNPRDKRVKRDDRDDRDARVNRESRDRRGKENEWFIPGDGIAREVITADIQRYLGPDATVKPGRREGEEGYLIRAYRTLTSAMIVDLKKNSTEWQQEQGEHRGHEVPSYRDSETHSRIRWNSQQESSHSSTTSRREARELQPRASHAPRQDAYSSPIEGSHYTTAPATYAQQPHASSYNTSYQAQQPRTVDPYSPNYDYSPREHNSYSGAAQPFAGYGQPTPQQPSYATQGRGYSVPRYFGYFDDYYLVTH